MKEIIKNPSIVILGRCSALRRDCVAGVAFQRRPCRVSSRVHDYSLRRAGSRGFRAWRFGGLWLELSGSPCTSPSRAVMPCGKHSFGQRTESMENGVVLEDDDEQISAARVQILTTICRCRRCATRRRFSSSLSSTPISARANISRTEYTASSSILL